jgi:hypothetical protein
MPNPLPPYTLLTRNDKGSQLTINEMDGNLLWLAQTLSGSITITGSVDCDSNITAPQFIGTSSYASYALTASYIDPLSSFNNSPLSVLVATTAILPLSPVYDNASSGIGAFISASINGALGNIDGVAVTSGDRILVKNQTGGLLIANGIYDITSTGSASSRYILTRSTDSDTSAELDQQIAVPSTGSVNKGRLFSQQTDTPAIGIDSITYSQITNTYYVTQKSTGTNTQSIYQIPWWTSSARQLDRGVSQFKWIQTDGAPSGSLHVTGSVKISGSLTVTGGSTLTNIGPAIFSGSIEISGSVFNWNSYKVLTSIDTGSFVINSQTSSMLLPYVLNSVTSSMTVLSSSNAATSSYINPTFISASVAASGFGIVFPYTGSAEITGSLTLYGFQIISGSLSQGFNTISTGGYSHAEGVNTIAYGTGSHAEGGTTQANGDYSHAEGGDTIAAGTASHAEGSTTQANGNFSHAEGVSTTANGVASHAEGRGTTAGSSYSHAEGEGTTANGYASHAEGGSTAANNDYCHAEGVNTVADGNYSHAEGDSTTATGVASHAEGASTTANGYASHAEGNSTIANGDYQHVQGQYNIASSIAGAFIIGNGADDSTRRNLVFTSGSEFQVTGSLLISGSITSTNTITCVSLTETSTRNKKYNIQPLIQSNIIYELQPVSFQWKSSNDHSYGFIAEDVNELLPEIVFKDEQGDIIGMSYTKIIPFLVQEIQNLKAEIEKLKNG